MSVTAIRPIRAVVRIECSMSAPNERDVKGRLMSTTFTPRAIAAAAAVAATGLSLAGAPIAAADMHLVGPGCAAYALQNPVGPASVAGLAHSPLSVAAADSPVLNTLAAAISGGLNPAVNLVETLDGGQFTVFAPTDDAFAKIDPATIESLKTDAGLLTAILTYHVVPGQASPDQVVGTHTTVNGATVTVSGGGDAVKVNDANVVCGGIKTTNATVYLIDSVLLPPAG